MRRILRCYLLWVTGFLLFYFDSVAQSTTITGTVVSVHDQAPLPGVTVAVKGQTKGTVTDAEGKFTLSVSPADILIFSFIGMETLEQQVGASTEFNITLTESLESLGEIVIVGYGTQKRTNLTGAVSTVDKKVLASRPITDVARGLQGTIPGVTITTNTGQIGDNPTIRLRGITGSLGNTTGAAPLVLVDNVEVPNLQFVNPEDIESISVLKDAASASIYGARGAFGVILITTKKGKKGEPTVSYSNNFSWSTPTTTPEVAPGPEGAEMALMANRRRTNTTNPIGAVGMSIDEIGIEKMREWQATYGGQDLGPEMVLDRDFEIRDGRLYFYRTWDPRDLFLRKWTPQQKHDLTVSGGTDNTSYYFGVGYLSQMGVLKTNPDEFSRYSLNLGVTTAVNKWLDTRAKVLYNKTTLTRPFYFSTDTYDPWFAVTRWPAFYPYGTYEGLPFRNTINEVTQAQMNDTERTMTRLSLGTTLKPVKGLTIDIDYTYDNLNYHENQTGGSISALNFWSAGPAFKYEPYTDVAYNRVQYNSDWSNRNVGKAFATYVKDISEHSFKIIAGGDVETFEYWYQMSQKRNLMDPEMGEIDAATGDQFVDGERNKWTTLGFFGRLNYSFKDKFLFEVNGRYDGSSRLSPDEKWALFTSASAGYVITEEPFMAFSESVLSFLKIRGSWGSIGNQNSSTENIYRVMNNSNSNWLVNGQNRPTVATPGALPASLTWETVSTIDLGLDSRFFNDQLGFTFDWYQRTTSDMHSAGVSLPATFGTTAPRRNYGEMQTTGWELALDYKHTFNNDFNISVTGMLSDFTEKITKFANTTKGINSNYEGKTIGEIWGYETDRFFRDDDFVDNGAGKMVLADGIPSQALYETNGWFFYGPGDIKYKDLNGDGVINYGSRTVDDHGDMKVIGNTTPRYQYGMRVDADWKGFDFSIFFQGVAKRDMWASGPIFVPGFRAGELLWFDHQRDYWTPENQDAFYPRPTDQGQSNDAMNFLPQTKYLLDMSYLRMKNVTFGYSLPRSLTSRIHLQRVRLYFSGENLLTSDNLSIPIDPEINYTTPGLNDPTTFGRVYPYRKTFSFGLQVNL